MNKPFFQNDLFGNPIEEPKKKIKKIPEINIKGNGKDRILIVSDKIENDNYWFIESGNYSLVEKIKELQPKKILTKGAKALDNVIGHKTSVTKINPWIDWEIPDQEYNCFIYPEYTDYAFKSRKKFKIYEPKITIDNEDLACLHLKNLQSFKSFKDKVIAIDFETSGLKPHRKGHFIYTVAITQDNLFTFSFELTEKIKPYLIQILQNENIKKVIQNSQYECKWSQVLLNTEIKGIIFDTQTASHVLDNRSYITGLKFQTYVNFGIIGYEDKIKKYLIAKEKGGNEFNTIEEADLNDILLYNGYDTYFTMLLYQKQKRLLDNHLRKGHDFFLEGNLELSKLSGIKFDKDRYEKNYNELTNKIDMLHNKIMNSKEIDNKEFNYNSEKQLRELIYDKCKWKAKNKTKSGKNSVDEETLKSFDKQFTNDILEHRKLTKIRDTYLKQFEREAVKIDDEYFIFPFFSLNNVKSYRSGSQMPNFQNIPRKDKYAQTMTRSCLIPRFGHQLLEADFKSIEVGVGCCYHFDPVMIDYITNNGDMHKDLAIQLFFKDEKTWTKEERGIAKGWIFSEFYGDTARLYSDDLKKIGYGKVTLNIWEEIQDNKELLNHLKNNGISNIYDLQKHIMNIENDFWNNRFKVYHQYKFDNWRKYKELGYIELYTGFKCTALMNFNKVNNYQIQGSAFHIALKTFIELNKFLRNNKYNSVILGEIHDSIILDIDPLELPFITRQITKIIEKIREEWKWIIVPLKVNYEITGINESWNNKKELKI
jgi:DNA polymerase-1